MPESSVVESSDERRGKRPQRLTKPDPYLDLLEYAAIVLSRGALLFRANRKAFQLLDQGDVLRLAGTRVDVAHPICAAEIAHYLASSTAEAGPLTTCAGTTPARAYIMQVRPLPDQRSGSNAAQFLMAIYTPEPSLPADPSVLQIAYRLTRAEARIVCELMRADSLRSVALRLGVTVNTARAHVKQVFRKLGVASQSQLTRLISSGPRN